MRIVPSSEDRNIKTNAFFRSTFVVTISRDRFIRFYFKRMSSGSESSDDDAGLLGRISEAAVDPHKHLNLKKTDKNGQFHPSIMTNFNYFYQAF